MSTIIRKLTALRQKSGWIVIWPAVAFSLAAIIWSVLYSALESERNNVDTRALRDAEHLARHHAIQFERLIDAFDQTLQHVKFEWELTRGQLRLDRLAWRGLFPPASDFNVTVADRSGKILTSTRGRPEEGTLSAQPYFEVHKSSDVDALYIGVSRNDNAFTPRKIYLSRRLNFTDGSFAGVIYISVVPDVFTIGADARTLGHRGVLGLIGVIGGAFGATFSGPGSKSENVPTLTEVPYFNRKSGSILPDGQRWFDDRRSRIIGWHVLDAYPLIATVALDQEEVFEPYQQYRTTALRYAVLATLAIGAAAIFSTIFALRLAERRHQLELTQAAYRMATEEGLEGFYLFRPMCDRRGLTVGFIAVDCNSRGAELFNLRREDLLGQNISTLVQNMQSTYLVNCLNEAMAAGSHEGELELPAKADGMPHWLRVKVARSADILAVRLADISDSKAHVAELERRGNEDALTGLPNRHWANIYLPQAIDRALARHGMLAILFIDLDGFKAVNDSFGHEAGDELLRHAGRRLKLAVRPDDKVVRIGGDEFVVVIEDILHVSDAAQVAERILSGFQTAFRLPQGMVSIGTSIGISVYPTDGLDANTLLRNADIAMYSVKTSGKRNYRFYDERFYDALRARMEWEEELRHAIDWDQFVIHYQPRVDISTGATSSMEALVRWLHPTKGLISPMEFVPMAEETGVILGLGALVIDKVCAQLAAWQLSGQQLVPVSINVSPRQFNEVDLAAILFTALSRHGVHPRLVEIELTESTMMGDNAAIDATLRAIQKMGVKVLIDDFGTGYSSLSQLQHLDFDVLKVDQAFTSRLEETEEGSVFFKAIITMAHALGMRVVAEGVETVGQVKILKALQCDEIQGFYVSRPLPPADTQPILPKWLLPSTA